MITAKEARQESYKFTEIAKPKREHKEKKQRKRVETKIKRKIKHGHNECKFFFLSPDTTKWLESLGYTVSFEDHEDEFYSFTVSW